MREFLHKNFEVKESVEWFGNGSDYIVPPEEGGSETEQQDFVLSIDNSEYHFIVRYEWFSYLESEKLVCDEIITFHYCKWYSKCLGLIPCYDYNKKENLFRAYKFVTGSELIVK